MDDAIDGMADRRDMVILCHVPVFGITSSPGLADDRTMRDHPTIPAMLQPMVCAELQEH